MPSATDELRKLLDERGVEYEAEDMQTNMQTYWGDWCFMEPLDAKPHTLGAQCELMLIPATPEQAVAATLGSDAKPCYAAEENYKRCKYGTNRGWCDDAPFLVWDDTGHLFITMGGLKTWDVTDDAKTWFTTLGGQPANCGRKIVTP